MLTRIAVLLAVLTATGCAATIPGTAVVAPIVSRAEFDQAFPHRLPFYSYDSFIAANSFQTRREAAAFLANVDHETGGLAHIEEDPARRGDYCNPSKPYGCPAGADAYFGRGPMQLSWNTNYKAAGDALGLDLLGHPELVSQDPTVAWRTALWYWNTYVPRGDFGGTINAINGPLECGGKNPEAVASRISAYRRISDILGVSPGGGVGC